MMTPADRQPIIVADAGPPIRLAAAGLLDTLLGLNRTIVLVDRVEDEMIGDRSKPFAPEIASWIASMGETILRVETVTGVGIDALRKDARTPERDSLLKSALRDSGELALREFLGHWRPTETSSAIIVYEDRRVAALFVEADFPVTIMTTRKFVGTIAEWGINVDAVEALEAIADDYDLKPAMIAEMNPDTPSRHAYASPTGQTHMTPPDRPKKPWTENLPFPRHWLAYIILKFAVLIAGVIIVLYLTWLVA